MKENGQMYKTGVSNSLQDRGVQFNYNSTLKNVLLYITKSVGGVVSLLTMGS